MTFTTLTFIIFLIFTFIVYWSLKKRFHQNIWLTIVSYIFYGWWDYRFCLFLFASSLVDYCVGLCLGRTDDPQRRKLLLLVSICFNLSVLGFFKYANFFAFNFQKAMGLIGWRVDDFTLNIVLPVGISFYTFQTLSYTIDVFRRDTQPTKNLINYLCYLSFFPQLVAGPIERGTHLIPQVLNDRTFSYTAAADGCRQILWGFFKKMVIADNLAPLVTLAYADPKAMSGPQLAIATVAFAFQVYCDFSAYSDIAIGTARLFGFDLMQNFAQPYFSQSMSEFWRRWHISLSTWLKDYVYIPLGGSRVAAWRKPLNLMITFLVSGFWHGAAWTYIIWGGLHGLLLVIEPLWQRQKALKVTDIPGGNELFPRPQVLLRILITFTLTCFTWIFFRAKTGGDAILIIRKILTETFKPSVYANIGSLFKPLLIDINILAALLIGFVVLEWLGRYRPYPLVVDKWALPWRWLSYTALLWATLFWGTWNTGQFVYFQF
jgi:alginate O-acetyltransferase complex protein AlgI